MKKLVFIPFLFACYLVIGQVPDSASIIGKSIKIGNFEVAQHNFPKMMNWLDAIEACDALGKGWKLPNKTELNTIYLNKDKIGGFSNNYYDGFWSCTEYGSYLNAWYQDFHDGYQGGVNKSNPNYVRAIRAY
jgi:hypothetical protein